jgi:ATP-dependent Zn protease
MTNALLSYKNNGIAIRDDKITVYGGGFTRTYTVIKANTIIGVETITTPLRKKSGIYSFKIHFRTNDESNVINLKNVDESVSSEEISRIMDGHSCAELEQVVNDAGVYAIYEGRSKISRNDLIRSAMRIIFNAPESSVECKEEDLRRLAVHEAGHCLVTEILEPGSVNLVSVNRYNGTIGGITSYKNNESYFFSAKYMEYRVISLLAGKAATEIVYADTDIGCNNDVSRAFDIVERFVDNYCNFGFDKFQRCDASPALLQKKETFMHSELDRFYKIAKQLIIENRLFFDEIVRQLMDKKTRASEDIKNIKKNYCNSKLSV